MAVAQTSERLRKVGFVGITKDIKRRGGAFRNRVGCVQRLNVAHRGRGSSGEVGRCGVHGDGFYCIGRGLSGGFGVEGRHLDQHVTGAGVNAYVGGGSQRQPLNRLLNSVLDRCELSLGDRA